MLAASLPIDCSLLSIGKTSSPNIFITLPSSSVISTLWLSSNLSIIIFNAPRPCSLYRVYTSTIKSLGMSGKSSINIVARISFPAASHVSMCTIKLRAMFKLKAIFTGSLLYSNESSLIFCPCFSVNITIFFMIDKSVTSFILFSIYFNY